MAGTVEECITRLGLRGNLSKITNRLRVERWNNFNGFYIDFTKCVDEVVMLRNRGDTFTTQNLKSFLKEIVWDAEDSYVNRLTHQLGTEGLLGSQKDSVLAQWLTVPDISKSLYGLRILLNHLVYHKVDILNSCSFEEDQSLDLMKSMVISAAGDARKSMFTMINLTDLIQHNREEGLSLTKHHLIISVAELIEDPAKQSQQTYHLEAYHVMQIIWNLGFTFGDSRQGESMPHREADFVDKFNGVYFVLCSIDVGESMSAEDVRRSAFLSFAEQFNTFMNKFSRKEIKDQIFCSVVLRSGANHYTVVIANPMLKRVIYIDPSVPGQELEADSTSMSVKRTVEEYNRSASPDNQIEEVANEGMREQFVNGPCGLMAPLLAGKWIGREIKYTLSLGIQVGNHVIPPREDDVHPEPLRSSAPQISGTLVPGDEFRFIDVLTGAAVDSVLQGRRYDPEKATFLKQVLSRSLRSTKEDETIRIIRDNMRDTFNAGEPARQEFITKFSRFLENNRYVYEPGYLSRDAVRNFVIRCICFLAKIFGVKVGEQTKQRWKSIRKDTDITETSVRKSISEKFGSTDGGMISGVT